MYYFLPNFLVFFFLIIYYLFIYLWLRWVFVAARGLFSSCGEWGPLFVAVHRLLIAVASLVGGAQALGAWASISCGTQAQ